MPVALLAASPETVQFLLMMLVVFGSAKMLGEISQRLGQPAIVGALLAGILIGPTGLHWVEPNSFLSALAELGVMFLLFQVGLEVRASELMRSGRVALLVAILGVIVPLGAGFAILELTGHPLIESIFMGAAMVATSVGITAQVLADKGLLQHRTAQVILAAAVIDDVLGLLVLAVVSSMAEGRIDILGLTITTVISVVFVVAVAKFGTPAVNIFLPRMRSSLRSQDAEFGIALIFLFGMSLLAVVSGVAAIIGAFLAGMALAESVEPRVHALARGATELMVPFFLTGIGMGMNLSIFRNPALLWLAVGIFVAAVASKWIGCGLGALSLGRTDANRIGLGMVPRGEVGMVVAQIGMAKGAISPEVYAIAVFMAVTTTMAAPPLLNRAYRALAPVQPSTMSE